MTATLAHGGDRLGPGDPTLEASAGSGGIDLDAAVALLWRFRWLLVACMLTFGAAGYIAATLSPPVYDASGTLLVSYADADLGERRIAAGPREVDDAVMRSAVELLKSREVLGAAAAHLAGEADDGRIAATVDTLRRGLTVYAPTGSHVIHASFRDPSPGAAALAVNVVMESYIAANAAVRDEQVAAATGWLGDRVAELREDVERAEGEMVRFREEYALLETGAGSITAQQLSEMNTELTRARARLAEAQARRRQALDLVEGGAAPETVAQSFNAPVINELRVRLAAARQRVAELANDFGRAHPSLRAAQAEAGELTAAIRSEADNLLQSLDGEVVAAEARLDAVSRELDALERRASAASRSEQHLASLEEDARTQREVYQNFLVQLQQTENLNRLNLPQARIISPAVPPGAPTAPRPPLWAALGVVAGALAATATAALARRLDRSVESLPQAASLTGFVPLAAIPEVGARQRRGGLAALVLRDGRSEAAESLRGAMTVIHLHKPDDTGVCLAVTSAWSGAGKSDIAAGLSRIGAMDGLRVLVVDGDGRRPALARRLDLADPGSGRLPMLPPELAEAFSLPKTDAPTGLAMLIPAGRPGKHDWSRLFAWSRRHFDVTLIDLPPVLQVADGLVPASVADAVVLVAVAGETDQRDLRSAADRCRSAGAVSGAVIVNRSAGHGYAGYAQRPARGGRAERFAGRIARQAPTALAPVRLRRRAR